MCRPVCTPFSNQMNPFLCKIHCSFSAAPWLHLTPDVGLASQVKECTWPVAIVSFYIPLCLSSHWSVVIKFFIFPSWAIFLFFFFFSSFRQTPLCTQTLPYGQNNLQLPYFIHAKPDTCCCILLCTEKCKEPNAHLLWLSGGCGTNLGSTKDLIVFLPFLTIGWLHSFSLPALRLFLRKHAAPSQINVSFPRHSQYVFCLYRGWTVDVWSRYLQNIPNHGCVWCVCVCMKGNIASVVMRTSVCCKWLYLFDTWLGSVEG